MGVSSKLFAAIFLVLSVPGCSTLFAHKPQPKTVSHPKRELLGANVIGHCQVGWIWPNSDSPHCGSPVPYQPQEGDLIFSSSIRPYQTISYLLVARVGLPHHVMLVVRKRDGELGVLEVGSGESTDVCIRPMDTRLNRLKSRTCGCAIAVRRIRRSLSGQESVRLTEFAEMQVGKQFTAFRDLLTVALPTRPVTDTKNHQPTWFCSELVMQALGESQLIHHLSKPKQYTPEDLYHDRRCDLSGLWMPPKDWTPCPEETHVRPAFDPGPR